MVTFLRLETVITAVKLSSLTQKTSNKCFMCRQRPSFIQSRWIRSVTFVISLGFLLGSPTLAEN